MYDSSAANGRIPATSQVTLVICAAILLFLPLFYLQKLGSLDFWWWMAVNNLVLMALVLRTDRTFVVRLKADLASRAAEKIAAGIASALVLYAVFAVGNIVSRHLFSFAGAGIAGVYALREGASLWRVFALMALIFGPGEELFWRSFAQHSLTRALAGRGVFLSVLLYAAIHLPSGNPMLFLAALVCGLFWGALYYRFQSSLLNIVSHTVWDVLVFLVLPF